MAKKNILVIDDEKVVHLIFRTILSLDYNLFFAESAQEGIDILTEHSIHLVLLDVFMPEISGIELLETIMTDTSLNRIPVIVVTADGSDDYREKAKQFGAVEFLEKADLFYEKENILKLVEKYASDEDVQTHSHYDFKQTFRSIMTILLAASDRGDFLAAAGKLGQGLFRMFEIDSFTLWTISNEEAELAVFLKNGEIESEHPGREIPQAGKESIFEIGKPYLDNKAKIDEESDDKNPKVQHGLRSEIGIPLYEITNEELSLNKWKIHRDTNIYGFILLKRDRVFSSKEFKMLTRFIIQAGAILFELHKLNLSKQKDG